jgi:predicted cupin superfamily sugar epimerase
MLTTQEIIQRLQLEPLAGEGGYFRETYRSKLTIPSNVLPDSYDGNRQITTAMFYLLTPEPFSAMHRLPGDEIFHFYLGDAVEMLQLHPDGTGEIVMIGNDIVAGMRPQVLVPGGSWQGSRLQPGGRFALMGTTMAPGFEFGDYTSGRRAELVAQYPDYIELITALTDVIDP